MVTSYKPQNRIEKPIPLGVVILMQSKRVLDGFLKGGKGVMLVGIGIGIGTTYYFSSRHRIIIIITTCCELVSTEG